MGPRHYDHKDECLDKPVVVCYAYLFKCPSGMLTLDGQPLKNKGQSNQFTHLPGITDNQNYYDYMH